MKSFLNRADKYIFSIFVFLLACVILHEFSFNFDELLNKDGYALLVALLALIVAIWQGYTSKRHNRLSVRPALCTCIKSEAATGLYEIELKNKGLGTARVANYQFYWDKKPVTPEFVKRKIDNHTDNAWTVSYTFMAKNDLMSKDESVKVLEVDFEVHSTFGSLTAEQKRDTMQPVTRFIENKIGLYVEYHSLYQENTLRMTMGQTSI